jgi:hypothetical protein
VVIPSPTPGYNCHYEVAHLRARDPSQFKPEGHGHVTAKVKDKGYRGVDDLLPHVASGAVRGFCALLQGYLADACGVNRGDGSRTGGPNRTILYGLQRPPLNGQDTVLRCGADTTFDELAPSLLPFYATNALDSLRVSVDPTNHALLSILGRAGARAFTFREAQLGVNARVGRAMEGRVTEETDAEFDALCDGTEFYNVVAPDALADNNNTGGDLEKFPLVGQFVSLYFPMGHIKSTRSNDEQFAQFFSASEKWLQVATSTVAIQGGTQWDGGGD